MSLQEIEPGAADLECPPEGILLFVGLSVISIKLVLD